MISSRCSPLMRATRSPDRTQTTAGATSHRRPIAPTHHRRGANQTADRAATDSAVRRVRSWWRCEPDFRDRTCVGCGLQPDAGACGLYPPGPTRPGRTPPTRPPQGLGGTELVKTVLRTQGEWSGRRRSASDAGSAAALLAALRTLLSAGVGSRTGNMTSGISALARVYRHAMSSVSA